MKSEKAAELFSKALEIKDPVERLGFLRGACGEDQELFDHIQKLLSQQTDAEGLFPTEPGDRTEFVPVTEGPGSVIGKYKILQEVGQGGMGIVYMAEQQEPFVKRVALKIIKLGMDTRSVVARFEAERHALALMNHPNIAKVLDAGATETGRPYFVMELVKGVPITDYCDKNKLSTQQRLELFIPVCQAIQHAHQKGIIHRDIKPSNVLVALFDGKPVPMVIDFGIAKATNQRLTEKTVFTHLNQFIGTPAYMSPEQAEGSQLDIDTRSDVYSLGILLYELLTGNTPFTDQQLRRAGWKEMQRIIVEDEPPKPSTMFSTLPQKDQSTISTKHNEEPRKISSVLKRELDWVVLKCLEKDRNQRYETANGLAMDVQRYLNGEMTQAVPPSIGRQFSKLARKHKKAFAMAAVIAVILSVATIVSTLQMFRAQRAEAEATEAEQLATDRATKLAAFNDWMTKHLLPQVDAWTGFESAQSRNVDKTLKDAIIASVETLSEDFKDQPEIEGEIRLTVGKALLRSGSTDEGETNLFRALKLLEDTVGNFHTNTLSAKSELGALLGWRTGFDMKSELAKQAVAMMSEAFETASQHYGETDPFTLGLGFRLGRTLTSMKSLSEADILIPRLARHVGLPEGRNEEYPFELWIHGGRTLQFLRNNQRRTAESVKVLDLMYEESSRNPEIVGDFRYANAVLQWRSVDSSRLWHRDYDLAAGESDLAIKISTKSVGSGYPTPQLHLQRVRLELDLGQLDRARIFAREQLRHERSSSGPDHISVLKSAVGLFSLSSARADWATLLADTEFARELMGDNKRAIHSAAIIAAVLSGRTNRLGELKELYFSADSGADYWWNNDGGLTLLSLPGNPEDFPRLEKTILECRKEFENKRPWFIKQRYQQMLEGFLAYRRGVVDLVQSEFKLARTNLQQVVEVFSQKFNDPPTSYMLAMTYERLGETEKARTELERANRYLGEYVQFGWLGPGPFQGDWDRFARAVILRDEAESLILRQIRSTKISNSTFQTRSLPADGVDALVERAVGFARARNYAAAIDLYEQAMKLPGFSWEPAVKSTGPSEFHLQYFSFGLFASYWGANRSNDHIWVIKKLHEGTSTNEAPFLYQLAEMPWKLPTELEVRRTKSSQRRRLEQNWKRNPVSMKNLDILKLGMSAYREGDNKKAIKVLESVKPTGEYSNPVSGYAFSAMAHWELGEKERARELLRRADEEFEIRVAPGDGMYPPIFAPAIMMEMVIKEADDLIDPLVDNAPYVASFPKVGFPE